MSRALHPTPPDGNQAPPRLCSPAPPPRHYWLPRTIRPTREGWWIIGATFAIGLAATNTGNNLLYLILAMMLSFMAISGVLSEQTMRRVRVQREIPRRLFARTPVACDAQLVNGTRRLPSYALHVAETDPSGRPTQPHFVLKVGPLARVRWTYSLTFPRRGRHVLPGLRLATRFPFGLFTKSSRPIQSVPVLVYPAVRALDPGEVPAALAPGRRASPRRGRGAGLYNLRPYRPGDDPRLLHWKTSARMGDLFLREPEDEDRPRIRVILEDPAPDAPVAAIEDDLSYAASVAAHAVRLGASVELAAGDASVPCGAGEAHLDRILERLALYAPSPARRPSQAPAGGPGDVRVRLGVGRRAEGGA
jgi:uncharacterized protein (DUF58 family)